MKRGWLNQMGYAVGLSLWGLATMAVAQDAPAAALKPVVVMHSHGNPVAAGLARMLGGEDLYNATQPSVVIVSPGYPITPSVPPDGAPATLPPLHEGGWQMAPGVRVYPNSPSPQVPGVTVLPERR